MNIHVCNCICLCKILLEIGVLHEIKNQKLDDIVSYGKKKKTPQQWDRRPVDPPKSAHLQPSALKPKIPYFFGNRNCYSDYS